MKSFALSREVGNDIEEGSSTNRGAGEISVERLLANHIEEDAIEQQKIRMSGMLDATKSISIKPDNIMRMSGQNNVRFSGNQSNAKMFLKQPSIIKQGKTIQNGEDKSNNGKFNKMLL